MNIGEDVTVNLTEDGTYVDAFTGNDIFHKISSLQFHTVIIVQ